MSYLRLTPSPLAGEGRGEGEPAAGTFPAWPDTLAQFKLLDPCAGSGHFLVSAFHYLVPMRRATEKFSVRDAIDKVLADNLHGLELDARCVEIAAFALALSAWRYLDEHGNPIGYRPLPRLNIACVGVAPRSRKADWLKLAGGDERLESGMAALYALFQKAPGLGSLIDPMAATRCDLVDAQCPLLAFSRGRSPETIPMKAKLSRDRLGLDACSHAHGASLMGLPGIR